MRHLTRSAALACVLLLALSSPVQAHATLVSTTPEDGAALKSAPQTLSLTFSETVFKADIVVFAPNGDRVKADSPKTVDGVVTVRIVPPKQRGKWTIGWRVVSSDGHPVAGSDTFTTSTGAKVKQVNQATAKPSFVHAHRTHIALVVLALILGSFLIVVPVVRRPRD